MSDLKEKIFNDENGKMVVLYRNLLKLLDNPKRKRYNNPVKLVSGAGICEGQTVLEIGCGSGFFTEEISKLAGSNGKVVATDIHPIAVKETSKKVRELGLKNVVVQREDAIQTSFRDNTFDMIILYGVIPAPVISLEELSKEMYRILKPDGICAIWTAAPFWRPSAIQKSESFLRIKRINKVFRLQKR